METFAFPPHEKCIAIWFVLIGCVYCILRIWCFENVRWHLEAISIYIYIWHKAHESMYPSCLVSTVQTAGGGVMVWGIISWHILGPLVPIEHHLNTTAYLSIVADHVHPFMTTVYPSSDGYFQQDNAPWHKAQIISDWFQDSRIFQGSTFFFFFVTYSIIQNIISSQM